MQSKEEWVGEQVQQAIEYVDNLHELSDKLSKLEPEFKQMVGSTALARIEDALPLDIAPSLSVVHHKAAVLIGRGLTFNETEAALGLRAGEVFQVHQQNPEFRRAIEYYQRVDEEEIGGIARQNIKRMLSDESIDMKLRVSLIAVAQKIGLQPHVRRMDIADRLLKKEQIEATREVLQPHARLMGVVEKPLDADFEVVSDE